MINEYLTLVQRDKHIQFDDAWYDDGQMYVVKILELFSEKDWGKLLQKIDTLNDATNLKVAKTVCDIDLAIRNEILKKIVLTMQSKIMLKELREVLYEVFEE